MPNIASKLLMNDGIQIPILGLGVYLTSEGASCVDTVKYALQQGYRHIDTAEYYGNELSVAEGIKASGIPRSEVFVTSKIWSSEGGYEGTMDHVKQTSARICEVIHAPLGRNVPQCYKALHDLKKQGVIKSVGVSNFGVHHLESLKKTGLPLPSTNQIELHPWQQMRDIVDYCKRNKIVLTAYSPLTKGQRLNDPKLTAIAQKLGKTNAQVLIKWCLQNSYVTIPKSSNKLRIVENMDVFDWNIPEQEMNELYHLGDVPWGCTWDPTKSGLDEAGLK